MAKGTIDFRLRALEAKAFSTQRLIDRIEYLHLSQGEIGVESFLQTISDQDLDALAAEFERLIAGGDGGK